MQRRTDLRTDPRTITGTIEKTEKTEKMPVITVRVAITRTVTTADRMIVVRADTTVTTEMAIVTIARAAMARAIVRAVQTQAEEVWAMADLRATDLTDRVVRVWKAARVIAAVTAMVSAVTAIMAATKEAMADRVIDSQITDRIRASLRNLLERISRRSVKMKRDVSARRRTTSVPRKTISTRMRTH